MKSEPSPDKFTDTVPTNIATVDNLVVVRRGEVFF